MLILPATSPLDSPIFLLLAAGLALPHVAIEGFQIRYLYRAKSSLKPAPNVLPGNCYYKFFHPNDIKPDIVYCRNPDPNTGGLVSSPDKCQTCEKRILLDKALPFSEYALLEDFPVTVGKRVLSVLVGLVSLLAAVVRLISVA